jgi:hypothetical protein
MGSQTGVEGDNAPCIPPSHFNQPSVVHLLMAQGAQEDVRVLSSG